MPTLGRDEDEHYELEASDEFHTYDATEEAGGGRVLLILIGIFVVVGLFGGVLYLAYQQGMKEGIRNAPPLIEADNSPIKVVPEDPGGLEVPNTDKLIYDRLNGRDSAQAPDGVEQLLPQAEEPMRIEQAPAPERPVAQVEPRDRIEVLPPPISITPDPETLVPGAEPGSATSVPVPSAPSRSEPAQAAPEVLPTVRAVPVAPVQTSESGQTAESAPSRGAATGGNYVVQIAAFRDLRQAEGEFDKLLAAHPELMGGLVRDVQRADLGQQGIYYRLRVGWFETSGAAKSLCDRLKAKGQDCIVRPK